MKTPKTHHPVPKQAPWHTKISPTHHSPPLASFTTTTKPSLSPTSSKNHPPNKPSPSPLDTWIHNYTSRKKSIHKPTLSNSKGKEKGNVHFLSAFGKPVYTAFDVRGLTGGEALVCFEEDGCAVRALEGGVDEEGRGDGSTDGGGGRGSGRDEGRDSEGRSGRRWDGEGNGADWVWASSRAEVKETRLGDEEFRRSEWQEDGEMNRGGELEIGFSELEDENGSSELFLKDLRPGYKRKGVVEYTFPATAPLSRNSAVIGSREKYNGFGYGNEIPTGMYDSMEPAFSHTMERSVRAPSITETQTQTQSSPWSSTLPSPPHFTQPQTPPISTTNKTDEWSYPYVSEAKEATHGYSLAKYFPSLIPSHISSPQPPRPRPHTPPPTHLHKHTSSLSPSVSTSTSTTQPHRTQQRAEKQERTGKERETGEPQHKKHKSTLPTSFSAWKAEYIPENLLPLGTTFASHKG